jgi:hypothetical protein
MALLCYENLMPAAMRFIAAWMRRVAGVCC